MFSSFTPSARTISLLSPVARIAVPRFVWKNTYMTQPASTMNKNVAIRSDASSAVISHPITFKVLLCVSAVPTRSA